MRNLSKCGTWLIWGGIAIFSIIAMVFCYPQISVYAEEVCMDLEELFNALQTSGFDPALYQYFN